MMRLYTLNSPEPPCAEQEARPYGASRKAEIEDGDQGSQRHP